MNPTLRSELRAAIAETLRRARENERYWFILTALRGCDTSDEDLKKLTVARLRGILGLEDRYLVTTCRPLTPSERGLRDRLLKDSPHHFRTHWQRAVEAVRDIYRYDLDTEKPVGKRCYIPKALR